MGKTKDIEPSFNAELNRQLDGFRRFNIPLSPDFRSTISSLVGDELLKKAEHLGFSFYQPRLDIDSCFDHSFSAVFQDKLLLFKLTDNQSQRQEGYKSGIQMDLVMLPDWVKSLQKAEAEGVFEKKKIFIIPNEEYLKQNEGLGLTTPSFIRAVFGVIKEIPDNVLIIGKASDAKRYDKYIRMFQTHLGNKHNFRLYK